MLALLVIAPSPAAAAKPRAEAAVPRPARQRCTTTGVTLRWTDGSVREGATRSPSAGASCASRRTPDVPRPAGAGRAAQVRVRACTPRAAPPGRVAVARVADPPPAPGSVPTSAAARCSRPTTRGTARRRAAVDPRSAAYIAAHSAEGDRFLHPDFGANPGYGIPYVIVPGDAAAACPIRFVDYGDESDPGPYPIPLERADRGRRNADGDRHVLALQQGACRLYELFDAQPRRRRLGRGLRRRLRPALERAAARRAGRPPTPPGLPILPGPRAPRRGAGGRDPPRAALHGAADAARLHPAGHALRRRRTDPNDPPMGLRLRLRADFDLARYRGDARVILVALKRYGMIVADNGAAGTSPARPTPPGTTTTSSSSSASRAAPSRPSRPARSSARDASRAGPRRRRRGRPAGGGRRVRADAPRCPCDRPGARAAGRRRHGRLVRLGQRHLRQGAARVFKLHRLALGEWRRLADDLGAACRRPRSPARCSGAARAPTRTPLRAALRRHQGWGSPAYELVVGRACSRWCRGSSPARRGRHLHPGRGRARRRGGGGGAAGGRRRTDGAELRTGVAVDAIEQDGAGVRVHAGGESPCAPIGSWIACGVDTPGFALQASLLRRRCSSSCPAPPGDTRRRSRACSAPCCWPPQAHVLQRPDGRPGGRARLRRAVTRGADKLPPPARGGVRSCCPRSPAWGSSAAPCAGACSPPTACRSSAAGSTAAPTLMATHSGVSLGPLLGRLVASELLDDVEVDLLAPYRPEAVVGAPVNVRAMTAADRAAVAEAGAGDPLCWVTPTSSSGTGGRRTARVDVARPRGATPSPAPSGGAAAPPPPALDGLWVDPAAATRGLAGASSPPASRPSGRPGSPRRRPASCACRPPGASRTTPSRGVEWRRRACAAVGLPGELERLQLRWTAAASRPRRRAVCAPSGRRRRVLTSSGASRRGASTSPRAARSTTSAPRRRPRRSWASTARRPASASGGGSPSTRPGERSGS